MKKTIGIITSLIFAVCAFVIGPAGASAETYKVSNGKSLSFTNAPTTKAGSATKVVTIKNDRKSSLKSSMSKAQNRTSKAANKESTQSKESETRQNTQEKKQSEEKTTQNEDGDNGNTKIAITNAPI